MNTIRADRGPPAPREERHVDESDQKPYAPLSGAIFTVLAVIATFIAGFDGPGFADLPAAIVDRYTEDFASIITADVLYLLAGAALLFFVAVLYSHARRAEGSDAPIAMAIALGATVGTTLLLAAAAIDVAAALRIDEQGGVDPQVATVAFDISRVLFGAAAPIGWAVALIAVARLSFSAGMLPGWLGLLSGLLGVILLIPQVSYIGMILFVLWPLVVGVVLYRGEPTADTAAEPS
jgi:hypothetical protein